MVFISYSSHDKKLAETVRDKLTERGVECWMAPDSISPGSDYATDIPVAIRDCDAMIVLLSAHSQESTWVPKEVNQAFTLKKLIIPLHIDDSEVSVKFRFFFSDVQQLEAQQRLDQALDLITAVVGKKLITPAASSIASDLPDRITLYELLHVGNSKEIDISLLRQSNDVTGSLAVPIGINDQGQTMYLDIHQKGDGPNGLIFGPAGTGKTEFINTFLISLALHFSSEDMRFYLVDFDRSPTLAPLSRLPHMAGPIAEENSESMHSFLKMLEDEYVRRDELLRQSGVANAYQYLKKRKASGGSLPPMPHMLIVIDGYGKVKMTQPEFASLLVRMAQPENTEHYGIHVLYATQKAFAVLSDREMKTIDYRICSIVPQYNRYNEEAQEEELVIHPGRLYFASPAQDTIQLMQLACSDVIAMPEMKIGKEEQHDFFWQFFNKKQSDALISAIIRYEMD
jgi:hypothetical protein